jgi:hypothetical protein
MLRPVLVRVVLSLLLFSFTSKAQQAPSMDPLSRAAEDRGEYSFGWKSATLQSILFLGVEHGFRLVQNKTRNELRGRFFADYFSSVRNIQGWRDGDSTFTNYVAHPAQGAVAGYIQIHNDAYGKGQEISSSLVYWQSRLKATAWSAAYSTAFEIGPISEATIGNVGKKKGSSGLVDFVITPTGGFSWIVAEDAVDRYIIRNKELRTPSLGWRRFYRMALNPTRTFANLLRMKKPWHRDTRPIG